MNPSRLSPETRRRRRSLASRVLLHNWQAKLGSLLAAVVVWYWIKSELRPPPGPAPSVTAPAVRFP